MLSVAQFVSTSPYPIQNMYYEFVTKFINIFYEKSGLPKNDSF